MKRWNGKRWRAIVIALAVACPAAAGAEVIWSDGFESGDFSAWSDHTGKWKVTGGSLYSYSGSKHVDITGPNAAGGDILRVDFSSIGFKNLIFGYAYWVREKIESENLLVEWSPDGVNWNQEELMSYRNRDVSAQWGFDTFGLSPEADNKSQVAIRLTGLFDSGSDWITLDAFEVHGARTPEPASVILVLIFAGLLSGRRLR